MKIKEVVNRVIRKEDNKYLTFTKYFGLGTFGFILLLVLLNGCNSDVDKIRNAMPEGITSVTIGDLLENSDAFDWYQWHSFTNDIGETIVEFNAKIKTPMPNYLSKLYKRRELVMQFILNKDGEGYKNGYCGYNLVLIDSSINSKIKFVDIYKDDNVYGNSKMVMNSISPDFLFKIYLDQNNIFNELYNKIEIISTEEVDYEDYIKRLINDKLLLFLAIKDFQGLENLENTFGKISNDFYTVQLRHTQSNDETFNILTAFFNGFNDLADSVNIQKKETFINSFDKLVNMGYNKITQKDNLLCKFYSTNDTIEKDNYLNKLYATSGRNSFIYSISYIDFNGFSQLYTNKSIPPSLQVRFKKTLAKCEVIKEEE